MNENKKLNVFNIDYEYELFGLLEKNDGLKKKIEKIRLELEYIYFFLESNETLLKTNKDYCPYYLDYLKSLGLIIPTMTSKEGSRELNWWGELKDIPLERLLNSKKTSTTFAMRESLCHSRTSIIETVEEIKKFYPSEDVSKWIVRAAHSTAGNGVFLFNRDDFFNIKKINKLEKIILESPIILEPYLKRVLDIGLVINLNSPSDYSITENFVTEGGAFKGGIIFDNRKDFEKKLNKRFGGLKLIEENIEKISRYYTKLGAKKYIQVDSFFFEEQYKIKYYPLVEVNYRKTMGLFLRSMKKFLPQGGVGGWYFFSQDQIKPTSNFKEKIKLINNMIYNPSLKEGIIPVSPPESKFPSFFIASKDLNTLREKLNYIQSKVLKYSVKMPKRYL